MNLETGCDLVQVSTEVRRISLGQSVLSHQLMEVGGGSPHTHVECQVY